MTSRDELFQEFFNIPHPWILTTTYCSQKYHTVGFRIDYNSDVINCPICGVDAKVMEKRIATWRSPDIFDYKTDMTACLPIVACHNPDCRVDQEQSVLSNFLILDMIVNQCKANSGANPLKILFSVTDVGSDT